MLDNGQQTSLRDHYLLVSLAPYIYGYIPDKDKLLR